MRPPDQIPNRGFHTFKHGETAYLWTGRRYSEKTVVTQHDWKSALTIRDGNGPMIVKPLDVISVEQFETEQYEEARERYQSIIDCWARGLRKSSEIGEVIQESVRATGQMIAAAKRWKLIKEDEPKP